MYSFFGFDYFSLYIIKKQQINVKIDWTKNEKSLTSVEWRNMLQNILETKTDVKLKKNGKVGVHGHEKTGIHVHMIFSTIIH